MGALMKEFDTINDMDIGRGQYQLEIILFCDEVYGMWKDIGNRLFYNLYNQLLDLSANCECSISYNRCVSLIEKIEKGVIY